MKPEDTTDTYQGLLGLDELPKGLKIFFWLASFVIATYFAVSGYFHVFEAMISRPMHKYFVSLSVISPVCIAVAVLRLAGVKWKYTLLLFIFVPMALFGVYFVFILLFILSGGANA